MIGLQRVNPVLDRELRQRSRSRRSTFMLTAFLLLLIGVLYIVYKGEESASTGGFNEFGGFAPLETLTVRVGRSMFEWVLAAELVIMLFIVPGVSSNAISGERDRQTLMPLQVTMMGPIGIFFGKVLSSSAFILLLVAASIPVLAVPFLVGGISLSNVLLSVFTLMALGFLLAMIGVSCSAIFKRTQTATLAAYGMALALTGGTLVLLAVLAVIDGSRGFDEVNPPLSVLYPNPFIALSDAAGEIGSVGDGPFTPIKREFVQNQVGRDVFIEGDVIFDPRTGEVVENIGTGGAIPLFVKSLLSIAAIACSMALISIRKLRAPHKAMS